MDSSVCYKESGIERYKIEQNLHREGHFAAHIEQKCAQPGEAKSSFASVVYGATDGPFVTTGGVEGMPIST